MKKVMLVFLSISFVIAASFFVVSCSKAGNEKTVAEKQEEGGEITVKADANLEKFSGEQEVTEKSAPVEPVKAAAEKDGAVSFPVSDFNDGKAKYYSFKSDDGTEIKYFILKSSDGVIRAAFDACDVCFKWKMGYSQEGDLMTCRRCGQTFPSVKINEIKGGCNPAPLNRRIENNNVVINKSDILEGEFYFSQ